jgi:hypothetical protein
MNNAYKQIRKFNQRIESLIDQQKSNSSAKRDTKGLLSRRNPTTTPQEIGGQDFTKRIANYVSTIKQKRLSLTEANND